MDIIKPTIGRVVWFSTEKGKILAAIVCKVIDDHTVNLSIFNEYGNQYGMQDVHLTQPGDDDLPDDYGAHCMWMPYQIGQAMSHDVTEEVREDLAGAEDMLMEELKASPVADQTVRLIAARCHAANREYCQSIGDDSQLPWDEAPEWQRDSAMKGVRTALANPNITASDMHEAWASEKMADGWKYGSEKDPEEKIHPCLVPFDQLPEDQQYKDRLFIDTIRASEETLAE